MSRLAVSVWIDAGTRRKAESFAACLPKDIEFEALLSVAQDAYRHKTGGDGDIGESSVSVETFANAELWP